MGGFRSYGGIRCGAYEEKFLILCVSLVKEIGKELRLEP